MTRRSDGREHRRLDGRNVAKMMLLGFWKPHLWKWFFNYGWRFFK